MFLLFGRIIIFLSSNVFSPSSCCLLSFVPLARIGLCGAQRFSMMAQHTFPCGWTDWGSWKHRLSAAGFHFITPVLWMLGFSSLFQVAILVFAGITITGTAFGFWTVRKFLVSEHGGVDVSVAQFVKRAMRSVPATLIFPVRVVMKKWIVNQIHQ
ncbi:hypothetical protein DY000_02043868 [Brassica cretica]|uniref:Uncharacterized protein n=1 Tax=Brassica cretica TaxID=69181 RepID=A0ABQ7B8H9_BRACR|nr:hypothetical protein DY000_02043868 [Brassica cretica]